MENRDAMNAAVAIVEAMRREPGPERDADLLALTARPQEELLAIIYMMAILLRDAAPNLGQLHGMMQRYDP